MKAMARACALLCALELGVSLSAQVGPASDATNAKAGADAQATAQVMNTALALRAQVATQVLQGDIKPAEALAQLRASGAASGLPLDAQSDLAYAAIDIGRRLVAKGKVDLAEPFFQAAEQALSTVVAGLDDKSQGPQKATLLGQLAMLRGHYLNNAQQAKADIDQAMTLSPNDSGLQAIKARLARTNAQVFAPSAPIPPKG